MQEALNQLLAKVRQKAPQLSEEDAVTVTARLLTWTSQSLDGIPEFWDIVEGVEYDKLERENDWTHDDDPSWLS